MGALVQPVARMERRSASEHFGSTQEKVLRVLRVLKVLRVFAP
jgi:hypothetical protein